jgi:hypothetical protein
MCDIPLDLQRRLEQRWAARFLGPLGSLPPQERGHEKQDQQLATPATSKNENPPTEAAGVMIDP